MTELCKSDVVIIGAGPVGLFAVFQCGMQDLSCHVIDSLSEIGGQCTALYPEKPIYDIPGFPVVKAADLIAGLEEQAYKFKPVYHLSQKVIEIKRFSNDTFLVVGEKGTQIECRAIIIAAGGGSFGPNRPPLEDLEAFEGQSVFYTVRDPCQFKGKDVVIAGGGDSAVDWAIVLSDIAKSVKLLHRRPKFRAAKHAVEQLECLVGAGKIELLVPYQLSALQGEAGMLSSIHIVDIEGHKKDIEADILLSFFGLSMDPGPIEGWGLDMQENYIVVDPTTCQTSKKGVYAIGDIAIYPNKQKLILTGFSEAAQTVQDIYKHLNPDEERHFEYSTTRFARKD